MTGKRSGKKRKVLKIIVRVFVGLLFLIIGIICYLYFYSEQIQHRMKERICAKVIQYEEELSEIAEEWPPDARAVVWEDIGTSIYYKNLEDEKVNKAFKRFHLMSLGRYSDEPVIFAVEPTMISLLWDGYMCGFYYAENDAPFDVEGYREINETEFEAIGDYGKYWYRTEKITDNWWYYERKDVWKYYVKK